MKKHILSIITALAMVMAMLPAAVVPANAAVTHTVSDSDQFHSALAIAQDGDTIQLADSFILKNPQSNNDSLVIDKAVTIEGGGLTLRYAGILLGADVTFKDITLGLASNVRNAIMANGHTLTLENVQRNPSTRYIHLFCGGPTGATQGGLADEKQGNCGQIIIKGNTNLGLANIYAGSISTDGTNNEFTKPTIVTIEQSVTGQPIEHIYASGALETPTNENDWFDPKEIEPPTPDAERFPVSGDVTFNLYQGAVKRIDGRTGTQGKYAGVNYDGSNNLNDGLVLTNIGGLNVRSGNLALAAVSSFATDSVSLGAAPGSTLGLQNLGGEVRIGSFAGGGNLVLAQNQKLTVTGAVSGATTVGIGGIFNGYSQMVPTVGATYIDAPNSTGNSFVLAAYGSRPDIKLVYGTNGAWTVEADENVIIVEDFSLGSVVETLPANQGSDDMTSLPLLPFDNVKPENLQNPFLGIFEDESLNILVNGNPTTLVEDGYDSKVSSGSDLWLSVTSNDSITDEALQVSGQNYTQPPAGTYVISVTVPAANSGTGQPITRTATLTVKAADSGATVIPVPSVPKGLVYTGQVQVGVPIGGAYALESGYASATNAGDYTAKVKPADGFTWENGSTDSIDIDWSIAKAETPGRPTGLGAAAPSEYGKSDGRITGTAAEMEYSTDESFISPEGTQCAGTEITGLEAGDYYVRYKGDDNHNAGEAVLVTVPLGPVTVQSIKISDGANYKTTYKVGEPLDVTGLTLTVTMSDRSRHPVPVAAEMVTDFNSAAAVESQTLTITYAGRTVTYTISITENTGADPTAVTGVTLNKSSVTLTVGDSERLTATVSPDNAANKNVTWASDDEAVATVDTDGTVTAVSVGTVVITVTTQDGGRTASCTVTASPSGGGGSTGGGSTGSGSTGGGSTGGGSTGGGSTGSGSTGGGSTGGGSTGGGTTTVTTRNPDGSTTTTVTNKTTGTVTETTRDTDGSTTVVETKRDGTVTTTDTARNGVKVETVSKPGADTSAHVTLPASVRTATVTLPGAVTPGTVAVDAKTGKIVKLSAPTQSGMAVKLDASAELILEDRSKAFSDTDGHWAKSAIDFATAHALFNGTSDTTFSPDKPMTRGMIAVVLHNFEGNPDSIVQNGFTDAAAGTWCADAINWITSKGITDGYGNGSFGANDYVTREQLVTFLYRYANAMGYSTQGGVDLSAFSDGTSVSDYASEAMRWAVGNGLIIGTDRGTLAPGNSATRAQAVCILNRFVLSLMK